MESHEGESPAQGNNTLTSSQEMGRCRSQTRSYQRRRRRSRTKSISSLGFSEGGVDHLSTLARRITCRLCWVGGLKPGVLDYPMQCTICSTRCLARTRGSTTKRHITDHGILRSSCGPIDPAAPKMAHL